MSTAKRTGPAEARRIVVKVGSAVLSENGMLRSRVFGDVARQISALREQDREVVLVSSGAIAVGSRELGWDGPGDSIPEKQAAAAVGQIGLVELYRRRFARRGQRVAQILVTRAGLEDRERFLNARHTLHKLLELGVVPIVNENDTVATDEIRFGDNDNLSATVVNLVAADLLVILTNVDGLYHEPPSQGREAAAQRGAAERRQAPAKQRREAAAQRGAAERRRAPAMFDVVESITPEIERAAQGSPHAFGRGGMATKLEAARAAARSGAATVLCNGLTRDVLLRVAAGDPLGTLFASGNRLASRKHWLAFTTRTRGTLVVDEGAARALVTGGKSLLAAGISEVRGSFQMGDPVACVGPDGSVLARGLVAYAAAEIRRIARLPARKIPQVLGYSNGDEVVHRDDLVLLQEPPA
jgi:glutamate 5-kinase